MHIINSKGLSNCGQDGLSVVSKGQFNCLIIIIIIIITRILSALLHDLSGILNCVCNVCSPHACTYKILVIHQAVRIVIIAWLMAKDVSEDGEIQCLKQREVAAEDRFPSILPS